MLTKTDLSQIKGIVNEETTKIREVINEETTKIVKASELRLGGKMDKLERKLDYAINFLDRDYLKLLNRVERIEEHLHLAPVSI